MADTSLVVANEIANARLTNAVLGSTNRESKRTLAKISKSKSTKDHTQYLYSTDTLKEATQGLSSGKVRPPRGKAGETHHANAKIRVAQQDGTSAFEPLEILDQRLVPFNIKDEDVRKKIISYGYLESRMDKSREWIDFKDELNEKDMIRIWNEAINDLLYGVRAPNSFPNYLYQQELIDGIVSRFILGSKDCLLSAIMRSGKCRMTYEVALAMGFKNILVVTGKTGVNDGWSELLPYGTDPHINYISWTYHNYNKLKKTGFTPSAVGTDVVFASLQYLNKHIDNYNEKGIAPPPLVDQILNTKWDFVVFDEQHWGTDTTCTKDMFGLLSYQHKLELSGTAYKTLIQGRYAPEDTFAFDYVDEQNRRFKGTPNEQLALEFRPDINYALINVDPKIKAIITDDGFSFAKLMAVAKGQKYFKNTQHVTDFLNFVKSKVYGNPYTKDMSKFKPYVDRINRHTVWILPNSIPAAEALKELLEQHPYFKSYEIILATAGYVKSIDEVKQKIAQVDAGKIEGKSKGTILLTLGRFLEGTTVPEWWCVHQMNDDKSAADYFQGSFRTKSEYKKEDRLKADKRHVLVYDYNPERFIQVAYAANIDNNRRKPGQTASDLIREWCEVSDVYDFDGNGFSLMTGDAIANQANQDIEMKINLFNSVSIDSSKVNLSLQALMINKQKAAGMWQATTVVNSQQTLQTPNQKIIAGAKPKVKGNKKVNPVAEAVEKFKQALCKISNLVWCTVGRNPIGSFDDIINYPDVGFIEEHTGLTPAEWAAWKTAGAIPNIQQIDHRIDALNESVNI